MIAHPAPEALLAKYGNTVDGRPRAREEMTRVILRRARDEAVLAGLSLNCQDRSRRWGDRHVPCGNPGGRTCLCACHDPQVAVPEPAP